MSQSITLRSGLMSHASPVKQAREMLKLSLRALLHRQTTFGWLQLLNSHPLFSDLIKAQPRLMYKIYRPYLSNTMDCRQRLAMLQQHYRFVFRNGMGPLVVQAARGAVVLAHIPGKSGTPYHVQLRAIDPMEREGELVLQLMQGEQLVYSSAFSFFDSPRGMTLGIGCMQGPRGEHGLQLIKDATRDLHGLRPKNLMLRLLRQVGHDYGCGQLRLVGNANRVVRGASRQGKVFADYDSLWQECDAELRADGDYQLDCDSLAAPDMSGIASKKRSEVRRRHEMLETLTRDAHAGLRAPRFEAVVSVAPTIPVPYPALPYHPDALEHAEHEYAAAMA